MLKSYFKTAFRNLYNNKVFSLINILGLAIGIASFILIVLYVYHELSYDRYHQNADRIYRIVENLRTQNELLFQSTSSPPMGPNMVREFPEVKRFVRFTDRQLVVHKDNRIFFEKNCYIVDSSVFEIFSFPMIQGNPRTALVDPYSIVLTESTAKRYFGSEDALNQELIIDKDHFKVTGVMKDVPENSHFTFDLLISFTTFTPEQRKDMETAWFWNGYHTFLLMAEGEGQAERVKEKMAGFIEKYTTPDKSKMYYEDLPLQPLTSIYLEKARAWENGVRGSKSNIYILSVIAGFILLIACFNYVNLATARASRRLKEVGLRKVMGANRKALVGQFMGESIIVSFIALILGVQIALVLLPGFNNLLETSLHFSLINNMYVWISLPLLGIVLGLLAGSYPALLVSGFHPLQIFKSSPKALYGHNRLRKMLVAGQFMISITFIAGTLLVFDQLDLMRNLNLGFNREHIMTINFHGDNHVYEHREAIRNELNGVPGVTNVTISAHVPGESTTNLYSAFETDKGELSYTNINTNMVDQDFISTYDIKVVAGRGFSRDFPADDSTSFMLNETAVKNLGISSPEAAIGKKMIQMGRHATVIGVVQDFNYRSLHYAVEPLLLRIKPDWCSMISLKINSDNVPAVVAAVTEKWKALAPEVPLEYSFIDQDYDRLYKAEDQLGKVVIVFSSLAVFVACLGLIGLTSFAVERRYKEIGIRKTLGASVQSIVLMISTEFSRIIIVAFILAIPITWYVSNLWLENFTKRISINPSIFIIAGLSVLFSAWLVTSLLSFKAALTNPTESLRNE